MHAIHAQGHDWVQPDAHPTLATSVTHVWRIPLNKSELITEHLTVLSDDERERVRRFYLPHHGRRYAIAHSALRQILAAYEDVNPRVLQFDTGEHGKPALAADGVINPEHLHFNLSHSGEMALLAVARHGAVGVDVERWRTNVHHLEIAERFFSPIERDALRSLAIASDDAASNDSVDGTNSAVLRGFFSTWSRKEAYLKATGHGIARGLHHFDVTMEVAPDPTLPVSSAHSLSIPARLIADRLDPLATERWAMTHIEVAAGYSGALVSTRASSGAPGAVALFESPYI